MRTARPRHVIDGSRPEKIRRPAGQDFRNPGDQWLRAIRTDETAGSIAESWRGRRDRFARQETDQGLAEKELGRRDRGRSRSQCGKPFALRRLDRSEEHTSELQSLMRISYAVFCLKKKTNHTPLHHALSTYLVGQRILINAPA